VLTDELPASGRRPGAHAAPPDPWLPRLASAGLTALRVGRAILLSVLGGMAFFTLAPVALGWHPTVVISGSMEPAIHVGDVVVTSPLHASDAATLPMGSIVMAADPTRPGGSLMHRVIARNDDGSLKTKGDANLLADSTPMPAANLRGVARYRIPAIGVPILRLHNGDPLPAIALVVMTVTLVAAVPRRRRPAVAPPAPASA
jgi:signal peptidase I